MKRKFSLIIVLLFVFISNMLFASCSCSKIPDPAGGEYNLQNDPAILEYFDTSMPEGTVEFTHSILAMEDFTNIIPLGQVNPPDHTFPTDHIYFALNRLTGYEQFTVYAPIGGKIINIDYGDENEDGSIRVAITNTMTFYLGHILVNEDLEVGEIIKAGDEIAINGYAQCVDFGLLNRYINNGFVNIRRVPFVTIFGDKPLSYYKEPLRSELYNLVKPTFYSYDRSETGVTDGKFAYDVAGTLSGNWVWEGGIRQDGWYDNDNTLSFSYDLFYPEIIAIGNGGKLTLKKYEPIPEGVTIQAWEPYVLDNDDNPIKPENVTAESGIVSYYIYDGYNYYNNPSDPSAAESMGKIIVQVLSDTRIRVEYFGDPLSCSEFTSASLYYIR